MSSIKPFLYVLLLVISSFCNRNPNNEQAVESTLLKTDTSLEEDSLQIITAWLKQTSVPVKHLEAGNGFADLQPLKQVLKDVKIVGLGESTHGTREMFQVKHRLLEFLVTEMGFNAFALEASYAACQPINEYVLYGKGDLATVLTGQGYVVWDTEEIAELIEWMRTYNKNVPEEKKVKFYGVDLSNNENGRNKILGYLKKVAPERVSTTESFFRILSREEEKWPMRIDTETEKALQKSLPHLLDLINFLDENRERLISSSSLAELEQALKYAGVMKQWIMANSSALRPPFVDIRSISMAENLLYLIDQEGLDAKFIIWEHNSHLSRKNGGIGTQLQKKYGDAYYAFSIEFNQGSFHTRTLLPGKILGDLKEVTLPLAPIGSFPWYLSHSNIGDLVLDLRAPLNNPIVEKWLHAPLKVYLAGWVYSEDKDYITELELMRDYDGIIFIDRTTPTRPTANAFKTIAKREGL